MSPQSYQKNTPDEYHSQRKKLLWESLLGFFSFFSVMALIQAIWNIFRPEPSIFPSVLLGVLLLCTYGAWRKYRRYLFS